MKFDEMYNAFDKIIKDVESNKMGDLMVQVGANALGLIRSRVTEDGINADGQKFPPYSNKPMLSGCSNFLDKAKCENYIGSKTSRRKERKKSPYEKYLAGSSGQFELKWVTLQRKGKNIRLFEIPGGYREFRELNLGAGKGSLVNFSFSSRMWGNIKIISSNTLHNNGIVVLGATTEEDKIKLKANTERKGQILALNDREINILSGICKQKIKQFFRDAK